MSKKYRFIFVFILQLLNDVRMKSFENVYVHVVHDVTSFKCLNWNFIRRQKSLGNRTFGF